MRFPVCLIAMGISLSTQLFGASCIRFSAAKSYAIGATPLSSIRGDFNGDGKLDIATLTQDKIIIQPGRGDGTFAAPIESATPGPNFAFDQGDFDGDGRTDLAILQSTTPPTLALFVNQGNTQFAMGRSYPVPPGSNELGPFSAARITAGDLNGDGLPDLVAVTSLYFSQGGDTEMVVFLNQGNQTFTTGPQIPITPFVRDVKLADFTGDGVPDILSSVSMSSLSGAFIAGGLQVLKNSGGGSFTALPYQSTSEYSRAMAVADYNQDGQLDVAYTIDESMAISVYYGDGTGVFTPGGHFGNIAFSGRLVARDYTMDGLPDLLAGAESGAAALLPNLSNGAFGTDGSLFVGPSVLSIMPGDYNGDGVLDLVMNDPTSATLVVFIGVNNCITQPSAIQTTLYSSTREFPRDAAAGDLNGDGLDDLAVGLKDDYDDTQELRILLAKGDGTFDTSKPVRYPAYEVGADPTYEQYRVLIADVDLDGTLDVAIALQAGIVLYHGNGDGTLSAQPVRVGTSSRAALLVDVNGDGKLDLVNGTSANTIDVYLGDGQWHFTLTSSTPVVQTAVWLSSGDFNGDGRMDIAAASTLGTLLLTGDGAGHLTFARAVGSASKTVTLADLNLDGFLDVVTESEVIPGSPSGSFGTPVAYAEQAGISARVAQFGRDRRPDIVQANPAGTATLYRSRARFSFVPQVFGGLAQTNAIVQTGRFMTGAPPQIALFSYVSVQPSNSPEPSYDGYLQIIRPGTIQ